jgi:hypothetical protein
MSTPPVRSLVRAGERGPEQSFAHPYNPRSEIHGVMLSRMTGLVRTAVNVARVPPGDFLGFVPGGPAHQIRDRIARGIEHVVEQHVVVTALHRAAPPRAGPRRGSNGSAIPVC